MKKRTLKKVLQFGILLFGIPLLLWNCEKEDMKASIVLQELDDKYHSRTITLDDIYDVKKHLDDLMPQQRDINKTSEVEGAIFDEDHVLEVIDTLQNTNYSLRFTYPDTPLGEFYNLVIGRTPEGVLKTPFVLKYKCDNNFLENYIAHDFDIHYFEGMVKMHVYTDFFSVDAFSKTTNSCPPEFDAVGDPVACEENPIGIGSGSGGPGGSSGGPGGSPGGTGGSSGGTGGSSGGTGGQNISLTCTCVGHSVTQINDGTCTCTSYVLEIFMTRSNNRTADDCPSCASSNPIGGIGVNEPNISSMIGNIKNALDLNSSELVWLHNDATNGEIMEIDLYINMNSLDGSLLNEAKEFGESAVEALMNNGEIDLFNRLIYNPVVAQDYRASMSAAEIAIFDTLSAAQQFLYIKAATNAYIYAETAFPQPVRNTKGDAFKHAFWNAISTVYIGEALTEQLTTAHENIIYDPNYLNHFKETQMDYHNNAQGRQIAYGSGILYQLVENALDNGNLRYLSNLIFQNGFWNATDASQLIPTNQ